MDLTSAGFMLLRGAQVYAPQSLGVQDVLLAYGKILAVAPQIPSDVLPDCKIVDLNG